MSQSARYWEMFSESLTNLMKDTWEAAGLTWSKDHASQVQDVVDKLNWAVGEDVQDTMAGHLANEPHLDSDGSAA